MELVSVSSLSTEDAIFCRILVNYGVFNLGWNERILEKVFKTLRDTLECVIFIRDDCCISKEKAQLTKQQIKSLLCTKSSLVDPFIFKAYFKYDVNTEDFEPRLQIRACKNRKTTDHTLRFDCLLHLPESFFSSNIYCTFSDILRNYLVGYQSALLFLLKTAGKIPPILTVHHFFHNEKLIRIFYPLPCVDEYKWRCEIHHALNLPRHPMLRRGMSLFPSASFRRFLGPNSTHLVSPHEQISHLYAEEAVCEMVKGRYTYKHYLQDGVDDKNWGCAYRSLQTLASWLYWQGLIAPVRELPSLRAIQESLVRVGDKPTKFINSRQWIGSLEVSFCLEDLFCVQCLIVPILKGSEFTSTAASLLAEHFASGGGPVMVGGGQLAHTIVGVSIPHQSISLSKNDSTSKPTRYLILDPHYTGPAGDLKTILDKGWVGWKEENWWKQDVPYNLCLLPALNADDV